ncbi:hypothetical protein GCM10007047_01070 [Cerasicoccus arenae]|uniref:Uncharacterized protein n=1 Tax=Cerasicoccus arenae TaxID=424488 RepID=A0A8J3D919_9BACT|nr:hypothetical protein GCM10007047_01070 [Cerasicoccus arenae]
MVNVLAAPILNHRLEDIRAQNAMSTLTKAARTVTKSLWSFLLGQTGVETIEDFRLERTMLAAGAEL